jgi:hypothetical protein
MNQIALLVALGATTGLFGSRHQVATTCAGGNCYASYTTPYQHTTYNAYYRPYAAPQAVAPAPAPAAAPAAAVQAPAPRYYYPYRPVYYYTAAPTCPNGQCYRR